MTNTKKTIERFLDEEVKEYSISVIKDRALPCVIDGFKPSQRKIIFTAIKVAARKLMKTSSFAGYVSPIAGYDKGDQQLPDTIARMVQDFPGSNNIPFLEGEGTFGSRFLPKGWSAPRYTHVKLSENFNELFTDFDILTYTEQGGEGTFEPDYYIPILPSLLLNGPSGIAVGFACEFQPYAKDEIERLVRNLLTSKKHLMSGQLVPYFKGFKGSVEWDGGIGKYVQFGKVRREAKRKKVTYVVEEIPTGISREKYIALLDAMVDKGIINDYEDECNGKVGFKFVLKVSLEQEVELEKHSLYKVLGLQKTLNMNMNCISEDNRLLQFNEPEEIVEYFVKFRLKFLSKRKAHKIAVLTEEIELISGKIKFISEVRADKIKLKFASRADMRKALEKRGYKYITQIMEIPVYNITAEHISKLTDDMESAMVELEYYQKITEKKLYLEDLKWNCE